MARTMTIRIKPVTEALDDVRDAFKSAETGTRVKRRNGVYCTSVDAARNLLTTSRLALLRLIRTERPGSIYELARLAGRDLKNVQDDLRLLTRYGLVKMTTERRTGKRQVRVPQALFSQIELKIAI